MAKQILNEKNFILFSGVKTRINRKILTDAFRQFIQFNKVKVLVAYAGSEVETVHVVDRSETVSAVLIPDPVKLNRVQVHFTADRPVFDVDGKYQATMERYFSFKDKDECYLSILKVRNIIELAASANREMKILNSSIGFTLKDKSVHFK